MLGSLILMFLAFIYSFFAPAANFLAGTPITFLSLGFFMFGMLGFGYLLPILSILYGLAMGANRDASIFIFLIPIALSAYAGAILGSALKEDFEIKKYFLEEGQVVATLLAVALIMAFAIEVAYPLFIENLPTDLFGFTFKEGTTATSMMDRLISLR